VQESPVHSVWKTSILFTLVTAVMFGLGYPLLMTGLAGSLSAPGRRQPDRAQRAGDWLRADRAELHLGQVLPSASLGRGQRLRRHVSGGTNLAQSNAKLPVRMQGDIDKLAAENPGKPVPIDMVTTSGSGLDPDITPDNAYFQAPRIAKARGLDRSGCSQLIADTRGAPTRLLGEPRVNVLD
jgi:potassium-transporting ATPase KdpC subunit